MTSMMLAAETMRAGMGRQGADRGESHLAVAPGCFVGQDEASNNDPLLRAIEKRLLRGVEGIAEPTIAEVLDVGNALDQRVVNRVRFAQWSDVECDYHFETAPARRGSSFCSPAESEAGAFRGASSSAHHRFLSLSSANGFQSAAALNLRLGRTRAAFISIFSYAVQP